MGGRPVGARRRKRDMHGPAGPARRPAAVHWVRVERLVQTTAVPRRVKSYTYGKVPHAVAGAGPTLRRGRSAALCLAHRRLETAEGPRVRRRGIAGVSELQPPPG